MPKKKTSRLAADIRASLREARDFFAGKPTKAIVHIVSRGRRTKLTIQFDKAGKKRAVGRFLERV